MNLFDYIKSKISILDVVSEYVTLKQAGRYWKGSSPFKNERTASFTVSPHKEIYYCFSTGQGGDVINFVSKMENCSQIEAAQHLIERYNLELPQTIKWEKNGHGATAKKSYEKICSFFAHWCHNHLKKTTSALNYLKKRSINSETINHFLIGYCPRGPRAMKDLLSQAKNENILAEDLINAHIIMDGKRGLYTPFEERIIFPIMDNIGRVCGFGGRIFNQNDIRAKYYNSRDHDFFNKSVILYGIYNAKKTIQAQSSAYLVEGYTDCIAMNQAGYKNTIATLGTACTLDHLKLLARYAQKLYVVYDGDTAGKKAILRLTQLCWHVNLELCVVVLPESDDPSSFLEKHGTLEPLLEKAQDIFIFFIEQLGSDFLNKNLQEKLRVTKVFLETINTINDPMQQAMLLQKAALHFDVPVETLKKQIDSTKNTQRKNSTERQKQEHTQSKSSSTVNTESESCSLEKKLFSAILNTEAVIDSEDEQFLITYLPQPFNLLLKKLNNCEYNFKQFYTMLSEEEQQFISLVILESEQTDDPMLFKKLLIEFQKKQWKKIVNDIKIKLVQMSGSSNNEDMKKVLSDFQALKKKMLARGIT